MPGPQAYRKRSFLEEPWVQEVLPFVTSVVVHVTVISIGVVLFFGAQYVQKRMVHQEEVIIPSALMVNDAAPGGVLNQGLENDSTRQAMQDKFKDGGTPEGWANKRGSRLNLQSAAGDEGDAGDSTIGLGPGGGFDKGQAGRGSGMGNDLGAGAGDGGPLAIFGTAGGGAVGLNGPVFRESGDAQKIAFVCDASGSMVAKFSSLRRELSGAIHQLKPVQSFSLIFFQEQSCVYMDHNLTMATPDAKLRADKFLEIVTPRAETNPIPALELAFKQQPDLIYFLTDGDFPDNDAVLTRIHELNKNGHVKINTIAFVNDRDTDKAFIDLLKQIAKESGGVYNLAKED
jgi:hypothetical protein